MRPRLQLRQADSRGTGRGGTTPLPWLMGLGLCALTMVTGCEEEARNVESRPKSRAAAQTGVNVDIDVEDRSTAQPKPRQPQQSGPIIGQRTTEIRNAAPELQKGGAKVASTTIKKDPIPIVGNAYVSIIGRTSMLNIQHAMDLYKAENDRYPKDYDEFSALMKANNIALPQLPPYQKYAYDEKEHKLILLEYPDQK